MAQIIKVLLYSTLVLLVRSQEEQQQTSRGLPIQQLLQGIDLIALSKLLQTAAKIAYPISERISHVVGNLREDENDPSRDSPYESHPGYSPDRRPNIMSRNNFNNRQRAEFQNVRRVHDTRPPQPMYYDYDDYEYDYDYNYAHDYKEPIIESVEAGRNTRPQSKRVSTGVVSRSADNPNNVPKNKSKKIGKQRTNNSKKEGVQFSSGSRNRKQSVRNVPLTNIKAPKTDLSESSDAQPKVIFVVVNPGHVDTEMIKEDTVTLLKKQGLNLVEDRTTPNKYYIVSDADVGAPNINNLNKPSQR